MSYYTPSNRDEYFFDLCRDAGFHVDDPADWSAMAVFAKELSAAGIDTDP